VNDPAREAAAREAAAREAAARAALSGAADGVFERVVHHLVRRSDVEPQGLEPDLFVGRFSGSTWVVAVVRAGGAVNLEHFARAVGRTGLELVLAGGGDTARTDADKALRSYAGVGLHAWHVDDDGRVHAFGPGRQDGRVRTFLEPPADPPDWPGFWTDVDARVAQARRAREAFRRLFAITPGVTYALIAVNVAVYLLGSSVGAPVFGPALIRLGALEPERVAAGEVWRLLSCTFLHGSVMHIGFNMFALYSLGSMLERVLGPWRFLLLYTASGLAGSVVSLLLLGATSVGASGAVWGLMAAEMALAWRGPAVFPDALRAALKRGSMMNLGLNVLNSLRPGVDWAAHGGGGAVGAVLVLAGWLVRGLPRWADPSGDPGPDRVPAAVRGGAIVSGMVLVASLAAAAAFGRPWELANPPRYERVAVGTTGWTAELPAGLRVLDGGPEEAARGDIVGDPGVVSVMVLPLPRDAAGDSLEQIAGELSQGDDTFQARAAPRRRTVNGRELVEVVLEGPSGARLRRSAAVVDDRVVQADALQLPGAVGWEDVATRAVTSARPD
jgi:membrane associated rhomboid family serine protease